MRRAETGLAETLDRLSPREAAGWAAAGLVVLGLHAAGFWVAQNAAAESLGGPVEAVMIELAPMPAAPEPVPEPVVEETAEPLSEPVEPEPEPLEEIAEEQPVEVPEPPVQTQTLLETPPEIVPEPVEDVAAAAPVEIPEPPMQTQELLQTPPMIEPQIVEAVTPEVNIPLPTPRPKPPARDVAEKAPPKKKVAEKAPPKRTKAPEKRATKPQQQTARAEKPAAPKAQQQAPRRASRVSPARWQATVQRYLNRHKRYPRGARSRGEEGTVQLSFAIDASGRVLSAKVARSSGYPELDAEVLAMVRRASPLPAPPEEIAEARMRLSVPVNFSLR